MVTNKLNMKNYRVAIKLW